MNTDTTTLLTRARQGETAAWDQLFVRAADRVLLYIRMRLGPKLRNQLESMDVLQEAYTVAVQALPELDLRGEEAFVAWLCRIAERRMADLADYHGAQKRQPPGRALPVVELLEQARHSGTDPITAAERSETRRQLEQAIERLEPEERDVLLDRFFEQRTHDDIAARLGRSPSGVRKLLGRALHKLGRELTGARREQ